MLVVVFLLVDVSVFCVCVYALVSKFVFVRLWFVPTLFRKPDEMTSYSRGGDWSFCG